jgi:sec-independent protein translocase protein TatA
MATMLAFGIPGGWEWALVLLVGLLIFGRRLPEIARSVGKSVVEFKRGLKDVKGEIETASSEANNALPPPQEKRDSAAQAGNSTVAKAESVQSSEPPTQSPAP